MVKTINLKDNEILEVKSETACLIIENKKNHLIITEEKKDDKKEIRKEKI